jgi:hypothetical protein
VALCIAAQLAASTRPKADPEAQSLRFIEYFWRQASINAAVAVMKQNARTAKKRLAMPAGVRKAAIAGEKVRREKAWTSAGVTPAPELVRSTE